MTPYLIWLRRGSGRYLAPVVAVYLLMALFADPTWGVEFDWASRSTASSILVVSPVVAAVAAHDTAARLNPALTLLARTSVRTSWQIAFPALAVTSWTAAAYLVVWVVALTRVTAGHGVGVHDWWVFAEVLAPLVAAGGVGSLTGMLARPRLAPILAVGVVFGALVAAAPWGRGPFEAVTTFGTLTGLQRPPLKAAAVVVAVLLLALSVGRAAVETNRPAGRRRLVLGACGGVALICAVAPAAWPWGEDGAYRVTTERYGCVGSAPAVCGPESRMPILRPVQASLADAYEVLAGTAFVEPRTFRITRIDHYSNLNGAAPLDFDPADVHDGGYSADAVARALVRPHQCTELFTASSATPLVEAHERTIPWLVEVLEGRAAAGPVPAEVSSAFALIQNCRPMTRDLH